ncbi:hypothetical protein FRC09_019932 [Ceratobasidium sp. 395]|nr:hypothetical protein FRC09_019932 [Ceratobasidium sp. 395]
MLYYYGSHMRAIAYLQDAKHAMKTLRNNLYNGTHGLVIGNCPVYYEQLYALAQHPSSPLFQRDVTKVDRQDDMAAHRVFGAALIRSIIQILNEQEVNGPVKGSIQALYPALSRDLSGLLVYLFIFGELIDAFQNRLLTILERIRMVMRAHFFLKIWHSSLFVLKYPATAFISASAHNILKTLIHGFMSLVYIYRDHLDNESYPFCPWLHSTEPCEHTFGEAQRIKLDLMFADFLLMVPKLRLLFDAAVQAGDFEGDNQAHAAGYFHSLYASKDIDIPVLSDLPTDHAITEIVRLSFYEAEALFSLCGIPVDDALYPPTTLAPNPINPTLPSIHDLLADDQWNDDAKAQSMACLLEDPLVGASEEFERIIESEKTRSIGLAEFDDQMDAYTAAGIALNIEEQNIIDSMPGYDANAEWKLMRDYLTQMRSNFSIPPVVLADSRNHFTTGSKDID